jgi:hypothetical protein
MSAVEITRIGTVIVPVADQDRALLPARRCAEAKAPAVAEPLVAQPGAA